jgi:superfamily I DNA and RNA helicase
MQRAQKAIYDKKSAGNVLMCVLEVYEKYMYPKEWIDNDIKYYLNMAAPICNNLTYPELVGREYDKQFKCEQAMEANVGVRCYTMHTSKGLEANIVYLLDVNEGLFPNAEVLEKKTRARCIYDASLDVRSERNLLYVAITRAKKSLYISYSNGQVATLLSDPENNAYRMYDSTYKEEHKLYNDLEYFTSLLAQGGQV